MSESEPENWGYPPERHLLRDLRLEAEHRPDGTSTAWIPMTPEVQTPKGTPSLGAVTTLVDALGGGMAIPAVLPNWIATADLTLHLLPGPAGEAVEARGQVARAGRTTVVLEVELFDVPSDAPRGLATMTFSVIERAVEAPVWERDTSTVTRMTMALPGSGFEGHMHEGLGLEVIDAPRGVVELPIGDFVLNSFRAVQGGAFGAVAGAAAEAALMEACGVPVEAVDLHLTYLELGRIGPLRTATTVLRSSPSEGAARVEIVDTGADDLLTTWATVACVA
ncbi:MAG: PaaI family thioesterase [Acidimicrobiia bacterium]